MSWFRDIIDLEDDYEVSKAKATIAVKTVQWCHELWYHKAVIYSIGRLKQ